MRPTGSRQLTFNRLQTAVKGVRQTINIMDSDQKKAVIEQRLREKGLTEPEILYHCSYNL